MRMGCSHSGALLLDTLLLSCLFGRPCTCNPAGSLGTCDPRSGRCPCKENVEGNLCDRWVNRSNNEPAGRDLGGGGRSTGHGPPRLGQPHHLALFLEHSKSDTQEVIQRLYDTAYTVTHHH